MKLKECCRWACAGLLLGGAEGVWAEWERHTIDRSSKGADGVRAMDVNRDGHLDLTTGWEEGGVIRVCLNPGPREVKKEWPGVTVGKVASPEDAVFVDLDGDGAVDVVSSCEGANRTMYVHWAPREKSKYLEEGAWKTEAIPITQKKQSWMYALPMDVDGRHGIDLVVGSKGPQASVGWLQAPEDPRKLAEWKYHRLYDAGWIMSIAAYDVDEDGKKDLILSDRRGKSAGVRWLKNPGPQAATQRRRWISRIIGSRGNEVMFLTVAEFFGGGPAEVLATTRNGHVEWFQRIGTGAAWEGRRIPLAFGLPYGKSVAVGDINLDGQQDVITTNRGQEPARCVAWQEYKDNPGEKNWVAHDIGGTEGAKFDLIELIDLDADGDLDVVTCEEAANLGVFWYENPTK